MEEYKYVVLQPPNCVILFPEIMMAGVVAAGVLEGKAEILSKHFLSGSGRIIDGGGWEEAQKKIEAKEK